MNVFGIGAMELLVILLVAFVALGPGKTIEVARTIGRVTREARRTFTDIMEAASINDDGATTRRPPSPEAPSQPPAQPPADPLPMPPHMQPTGEEPQDGRGEPAPEPPGAQR